MTRALVSGDQLGESVGGQEGNITVGDDDGSAGRGNRSVKRSKTTLNSASSAGDLILVGDDGPRIHTRNFCGDDLTLVTHNGDHMIGIEAAGCPQRVTDHGQASKGMHNLREG